MTGTFLFGNQSSHSKYLLEFKAGKMQMKGNTVNPLSKKGLVYLHKSEDNLMHFCWKDRQSGQVEDDLIIFPDDTEFKKVPQCTKGRVFVLKFKSSNRRCFYWMQEPKEDKDDEICKKVNDFLNNPSASTSRSGSSGHGMSDLPDSDLSNLVSNVNPQQLMQILSRVNNLNNNNVLASFLNQSGSRMSRFSGSSSNSLSRNSTKASSSTVTNNNQEASTNPPVTTQSPATVTTPAVTTAPSAIQLSDLQNIISGLAVNQVKKDETNVDLASIINSDALKTLLANKDFMDKVKELLPDTSEANLPQQTLSEQVASTIESVQFKSALSTFNSALQSGLLGPLIQQFNLSEACVEAANKGDLEAFIKAIESSKTNVKKTTNTEKKDIGDSDMATD